MSTSRIFILAALFLISTGAAVSPAAADVYYTQYPMAPFTVRPVAPLPPSGAYAAPAAPPVVYTLPNGCQPVQAGGVVYANCGNAWYRPYYYGPNLVYAPVPAPY